MKRVEIEAFEDRSRPEGGHAVIVLRGIEGVSGCPAFRLRPVEAGGAGSPLPPWAVRELKPLAVEMRDGSAGLIVGPELTDSPALQPGVPLEISVPALGVRGEFLWPAVAPPSDATTGRIVTSVRATPVAQTDTFDFAVVEDAATAPPKTDPGAADRDTVTPDASLPRPVELRPVARAAAPSDTDRASMTEVAKRVSPVQSPAPDLSPRLKAVVPLAAPVSASECTLIAPPEPQPEPQAHQSSHPVTDRMVAKESQSAAGRQPAANTEREPIEPRGPDPTDQAAAGAGSDGPVQHASTMSKASEPAPASLPQAIEAPLTRGGVGPEQRTPLSRTGVLASVMAAVLGLQLIGLVWFDVKIARRGAHAPVPVVAARANAPTLATTPPPVSAPLIYDALARGPVSPRGVAAEGVSPARALERAHALLHGGSERRDTEEGIYWLKHHLAASVGTERSGIVLTQLGSAYAEPSSGPPEFGRARAVWELAAAFGDPVAMCFLAVIHERGLGVGTNTAIAKAWLSRAEAAGGNCPTATPAGVSAKR